MRGEGPSRVRQQKGAPALLLVDAGVGSGARDLLVSVSFHGPKGPGVRCGPGNGERGGGGGGGAVSAQRGRWTARARGAGRGAGYERVKEPRPGARNSESPHSLPPPRRSLYV